MNRDVGLGLMFVLFCMLGAFSIGFFLGERLCAHHLLHRIEKLERRIDGGDDKILHHRSVIHASTSN